MTLTLNDLYQNYQNIKWIEENLSLIKHLIRQNKIDEKYLTKLWDFEELKLIINKFQNLSEKFTINVLKKVFDRYKFEAILQYQKLSDASILDVATFYYDAHEIYPLVLLWAEYPILMHDKFFHTIDYVIGSTWDSIVFRNFSRAIIDGNLLSDIEVFKRIIFSVEIQKIESLLKKGLVPDVAVDHLLSLLTEGHSHAKKWLKIILNHDKCNLNKKVEILLNL
jgi:hypothetical protein